MEIFLYAAGLYLLCLVSWILYLAVMKLKEQRKNMRWFAKANAILLLAVAYPIDVLLNAMVGSLIFLEPPRELVLTSRLKRHKAANFGWRAVLANWICERLLNQFDPDGRHC